MKSARQEVILKIISENDIETQSQLMHALREHGVSSTQATLSRDIKELRLVKELAPSGRYRYTEGSREAYAGYDERLRNIFREGVISCDTAQNLIVVKTLPGLAMAASSAIDSMDIPGLVGTVAGDDTAFIAMRDVKAAEALCTEIKELF
jgi:transcriptional regulator of arginine metabolism